MPNTVASVKMTDDIKSTEENLAFVSLIIFVL